MKAESIGAGVDCYGDGAVARIVEHSPGCIFRENAIASKSDSQDIITQSDDPFGYCSFLDLDPVGEASNF